MSEADLGAPVLALLALLSALCGAAMAWLMRRFSDRDALARTRQLIVAHLLEFRLFSDDPALVWRAQGAVAWQSLRLLRLVLIPAALITAAMVILYPLLDGVFGHAPLEPGQTAVVTARGKGTPTPRLEASGAVAVETPAVRSAAAGEAELSWRIRALREGAGQLQLSSPASMRAVACGRGLRATFRSAAAIGSGRAIEVHYPPASILGFPWLVWFTLFSAIAFFWIK